MNNPSPQGSRCSNCPALVIGAARCQACSERRKRKHAEMKDKRICADCGNPNDNPKSVRSCLSCAKRIRDRYASRRDAGVCVKCGNAPAEEGKHVCTGCKLDNRHRDRKKNRKLRAQVIEAYGSKCACCDETTPEFLQVDHINADGNAHRRELFGNNKDGNGVRIYTWLRQQGFPKEGFQLLCANCNFAKGHYGECPHQRMKCEKTEET